jgi:hypothetical protein
MERLVSGFRGEPRNEARDPRIRNHPESAIRTYLAAAQVEVNGRIHLLRAQQRAGTSMLGERPADDP